MVRYVNFVKLPHTVFALPFALLGVVYASFERRVTVAQVVLVALAFTAARFAAMGFNRVVDRELDVLNPRTSNREIPRGLLSTRQAVLSVIVAIVVFVGAAALLNPLCLALSPVAVAWVLGYSYTKRFTTWCHLWLGGALAIAPIGGYLAVMGAWSDPPWLLLLLALAVVTWVAGFDIFYSLQDEGFDRRFGLKSLVVRLGPARAILAAKQLHWVTIASLVAFGLVTQFGTAYYAGLLGAAGIVAWEHHLVRPGDLRRLDAAFFTMNGIMSIVVLLGALGDRIV